MPADRNGGRSTVPIGTSTPVALGIVIMILSAGAGAAVWLNLQLQSIQFEIRSLREEQGRLRRVVETNSSAFITRSEMNAWIKINQAKAVQLQDLPPR